MTEPIDDIHAMSMEATREIRALHAEARQRMLAGYPDAPKVERRTVIESEPERDAWEGDDPMLRRRAWFR